MKIRRGFTMIELIVVLVLLGAIASMIGLSIRNLQQPAESSRAARVFAARQQALETGAVVVVPLSDSGGAATVAAQPDGSVIADSGARIDRFTGRFMSRAEAGR